MKNYKLLFTYNKVKHYLLVFAKHTHKIYLYLPHSSNNICGSPHSILTTMPASGVMLFFPGKHELERARDSERPFNVPCSLL